MQLMYRGYVYNCSTIVRNSLPPRAVNWRYQLSGTAAQETTVVRHYSQPLAINWRYQVPEMI